MASVTMSPSMPCSRMSNRARLTRFACSSGGMADMTERFTRNSDRGAPFTPAVGSAIDRVEKVFLNGRGQRAAPSVSNLAVIHFYQRGHFGAGSGKKSLVGDKHVVAGEQFFAHLDVSRPRQANDGVASDTIEQIG